MSLPHTLNPVPSRAVGCQLPLTVSWCERADAGLTTSHPVVLPSPTATTGGMALP